MPFTISTERQLPYNKLSPVFSSYHDKWTQPVAILKPKLEDNSFHTHPNHQNDNTKAEVLRSEM